MTKYATLMGNIESIKITSGWVQKELAEKSKSFYETIDYLKGSLRELVKASTNINDENSVDIQKKLENIIKTEKQELNYPLIKFKKSIELEEKKIIKITESIKSSNDNFQTAVKKNSKAKPQLTPENNFQLNAELAQLTTAINDQKKRLDCLFDELNVINQQITDLTGEITPYDYSKEQDKLANHIHSFNDKFKTLTFSKISTKLRDEMQSLQTLIEPLNITNDPENIRTIIESSVSTNTASSINHNDAIASQSSNLALNTGINNHVSPRVSPRPAI